MPTTERDPYDLSPRLGEMQGEIHDASKCCIAGWGAYVASVCRSDGSLLFNDGRAAHNVFEAGFRIGDTAGRTRAYEDAARWLKETAQARGLRPMLRVSPPQGFAGKTKLVEVL